jgi:predicted small secreted protein
MKTGYKFILALLACLVCGCPRNSATDAGTDIGSDIPVGAVTAVDAPDASVLDQ